MNNACFYIGFALVGSFLLWFKVRYVTRLTNWACVVGLICYVIAQITCADVIGLQSVILCTIFSCVYAVGAAFLLSHIQSEGDNEQ